MKGFFYGILLFGYIAFLIFFILRIIFFRPNYDQEYNFEENSMYDAVEDSTYTQDSTSTSMGYIINDGYYKDRYTIVYDEYGRGIPLRKNNFDIDDIDFIKYDSLVNNLESSKKIKNTRLEKQKKEIRDLFKKEGLDPDISFDEGFSLLKKKKLQELQRKDSIEKANNPNHTENATTISNSEGEVEEIEYEEPMEQPTPSNATQETDTLI